MNYLKLLFLVCIIFPYVLHAEEFDSEKYIAKGAIKLFTVGCLLKYPDPNEFNSWVNSNHFDVIPDEQARGIVRENGGKAYSVNNNGVRYLLVAEAGNMCTVFVKKLNLDKANNEIINMRKGLSSSKIVEKISKQEKSNTKGKISTTHYDYIEKESNNRVMKIVISQSKSEKGFFQLALTGITAKRANKRL